MTLDEFYKQTNKISAFFNELGLTDTHKPAVDIMIHASSNYKQYNLHWGVDDANSFAEFADIVNEDLFFDSDDIKDGIKKFLIETLRTYDFSFTKDCYDDECKIYSGAIIRYNEDISIKLKVIYELS